MSTDDQTQNGNDNGTDELEGVQLLQYTQASARFTGLEGHVRQRITRHLGVTLFGDVVNARLADGYTLEIAEREGSRI